MALRRNERGIIDEIKTILVMILLSLVVSLGIMPEVIAEAALTKMSWEGWNHAQKRCHIERSLYEKPLAISTVYLMTRISMTIERRVECFMPSELNWFQKIKSSL